MVVTAPGSRDWGDL